MTARIRTIGRGGGGGILTVEGDERFMRLMGLWDDSNDAGRSNYESLGDYDPPGRDPEPDALARGKINGPRGPYATAVAEANKHIRPRGDNRTLTPDQVRMIRRMSKRGMGPTPIAQQLGISLYIVRTITQGTRYRDVE